MSNITTKLAILDFDGTLIHGQSQRLLIEFFFKKKYLSRFKYLVLMSWFGLFKLNIFRNLTPIYNFATSSIGGRGVSELESAFDDFFAIDCMPLIYRNSRELVDFLKAHDYQVLLVSSAIDPIISRARNYLGIDEIISTKLEIVAGIYTGKIEGDPVFFDNKVTLVRKYVESFSPSTTSLAVFADHFTDIPLLSMAVHPVAVNPSSKLWKYAKLKKWPMLYLYDDESFQRFKSNIMFQ